MLPFRLLGLHWMVVMGLALGLCLGLGTVGHGQMTTEVASSSNPATYGKWVTFTVTIKESGSAIQTPSGTVSLFDNDNFVDSKDLAVVGAASVDFVDICFLSVGEHEIRAEYSGFVGTGYTYLSSSGSLTQTVNRIGTTLSITAPTSAYLGEPYVVEGSISPVDQVTDCGGTLTPTGTVSVNDGHGGTCAANLAADGNWACGMTSSSLSVTQLTATYEGDENFNGSSDTESHTVNKRATTTTVMGSDTPLIVNDTATFTVTVMDTSPGTPSIPTGAVNVTVSPDDEGSPVSGWLHPLIAADAGQFTFTYTPSKGDTTPHVFTAVYAGSTTTHEGSTSAHFDQAIIKRAVDIELICTPVTAYIGQAVTVTVHVEDDTTGGTPGDLNAETVTLSTSGTGVFSNSTPALDGSGNCTVTYTPGPFEAGTTTITATYAGSSVYTGKSATQQLTVELRPTETTVDCVDSGSDHDAMLVNETGTCTVTVKDASGVALPSAPWPQGPVGTLKITSSLESASMGAIFPAETTYNPFGPGSGGKSQVSFPYGCTSLVNDADFDTIGGIYTAGDGIYADSAGGYAQAIYRRPTVTTVTLTATDTGYTAEVTVEEESGLPGIASYPLGKAVDVTDDSDFCILTPGSLFECSCGPTVVATDALIANVTVRYEPSDGVHLKSTGSAYVTRENATNLPSGGNAGSMPPAGAKNIDAIILGLNSGVLAANTLALIFDAAALAVDPIPDPIVGVGAGCIVVVVTGVTIPTSDIAATIIGIARIALQTYVIIATTDLDGDGLPGIVELVTHTADDTYDSDGDGLGDGYEVTVAGGFYGPYKDPGDYKFGDTACPNPNIEDSDKEGIIDGKEGFYNTSWCDPDTDDDTLTDAQEVGTWECTDPRDHANPLVVDSDGDGLDDDIEFSAYPACASCPYVDDDDSDDDGLQDGYEDANQDGNITNIPGDSTSHGSGETHFCNPDTDGDGLLDGEEEGLFGTQVTPEGVSTVVGSPGGTILLGGSVTTVPALDSDMDNDGLTDYEEVNAYQTNPMDADTDNDMLSDGEEIATWDSVIAARLGTTASSDSRNHANPREADTDGDGLTDNLEIAYDCNCGTGQDGYVNDDDSDDDGLQDGREFELFVTGADVAAADGNNGELHDDATCCLCDPDSDGDGLKDGEEDQTGTDPLDWDSDDDGLSDKEELQVYFTDPNDPDTDDDNAKGILVSRPAAITLDGYPAASNYANILLESDGEEALSRTGVAPFGFLGDQSDPLSKDTDGDGLQDDVEFAPGCNCDPGGNSNDGLVNDDDSDDDGLQDGEEYELFVVGRGIDDVAESNGNDGELNDDPVCAICDYDSDGDGLSDGEEIHIGTDPLDWDSDDDGLSDTEELQTYFTDPNNDDTDGDGADGNIAARDHTIAPTLPGHSGTGPIAALSDCEEAFSGTSYPPFGNPFDETDPLQLDTDGDGLGDEIEFKVGCSCEANEWVDCPDGTWVYADPNYYAVVYDPMRDGYANSFDSDGDGLRDNLDIATDVDESDGNNGELYDDSTHSICDPDSDGDGLLDGEEFQTGTDWLDWDSDDDGLSDLEELQTYFTDPNNDDTDGDMADGNIAARDHTIAPTLPGHSGTGPIAALSDCEEAFSGTSYPPFGNPFDETDPLQLDTDGDGLGDEIEFKVGCSCATTDWSDCPTNPSGWQYADPNHYGVDYDPIRDGYANNYDSDDDGLRDGKDVHEDLVEADVSFPGKVFTILGEHCVDLTLREQRDDSIHSICDPDSDGDGLLDGEEFAIGTDWLDWDTDDDGRNDWHEQTGGGPIPTDPFDPDTDDDGLLDSAEVFGSNNTNPANADTDGDGLCDGGTRTPWMTSGDVRVVVNPICKSCATVGATPCATPLTRLGSPDGIGDHPNPLGIGEDESGEGTWDPGETDPNQYDTDGDVLADGIERLSFSTTRQQMIPTADIFGRPITVVYPEANNVKSVCGCLDPLDPDSDNDGLSDGYEDRNHDGNFDFLPSEFDHQDPLPGPPIPYPTETNPCDPDTDHDGLTDWEEQYQRQPLDVHFSPLPIDNDGDGAFDEDPVDGIDNDLDGLIDEDPTEEPIELTFNPTNPLDHDTDNDRIYDGPEVYWVCVAVTYSQLDNDGDALIDEDPIDLLDNDNDGLFDEDPVDFFVRFVPMLDPTNRDSDSDGWIDGLDDDPCNSELIPILQPVQIEPIDSDGDGFSDDDEIVAGTHPNDPEDHPTAYCMVDLDFDQEIDDRLWLEPSICCGIANSVAIDIDSNVLIDARLQIVQPRDVKKGDFDGDGVEDDYRYVVEYAFSNYRVLQPRIVATIDDYNGDLVIDWVVVEKK